MWWGDPDQSIYSWRSADIRNILSFQQDYPDAVVISLDQNYRSTVKILDAAKHLISVNGMRLQNSLFTDNAEGAPLEVHEAYDEDEEASYVITEVDRLVREENMQPGDCAVMYRVNAQSRALEEACLHQGMKYRLVGGVRFYQRREVKDLMAYLRLLHNSLDEVSLFRVISVPSRGIGTKTLQDLAHWSQREDVPLFTAMQSIAAARSAGEPSPVSLNSRAVNAITAFVSIIDGLLQQASQLKVVELIDRVLEGLRLETLHPKWRRAGRGALGEYFGTPGDSPGVQRPGPLRWPGHIAGTAFLVADVDNYQESEDSMTLITLHQAKGLEFPAVFIVGLEEGLLPHSRSMDSEEQLEEERRLCYVGMTRAQRRLYLLRAFKRGFMGRSGPTLPSRFLRDIPQGLLSSGKNDQT